MADKKKSRQQLVTVALVFGGLFALQGLAMATLGKRSA